MNDEMKMDDQATPAVAADDAEMNAEVTAEEGENTEAPVAAAAEGEEVSAEASNDEAAA